MQRHVSGTTTPAAGAKATVLALSHSQLTPSLGVNPFEFLDELFSPKTRVLGLSVSEDFVILGCVILTQCQRVTDGRTDRDRQKDGQTS